MAIRHALGVPNTSHRYLIEELSGCPHPKTMLSSRLVKFLDTMLSSSKSSVKLLSWLTQGDHRTVMGKNMGRIEKDLKSDKITATKVKKELRYFPVPEEQAWRIPFIKELIEVRSGNATMSNIEAEDVTKMINILCTT